MSKTNFRSGFTLIELLVVIAIIAILAAILFPVFTQAKVAAKKTAALSQSKQIGLSIHIYARDYNDILPITSMMDSNNEWSTHGADTPHDWRWDPNGSPQSQELTARFANFWTNHDRRT